MDNVDHLIEQKLGEQGLSGETSPGEVNDAVKVFVTDNFSEIRKATDKNTEVTGIDGNEVNVKIKAFPLQLGTKTLKSLVQSKAFLGFQITDKAVMMFLNGDDLMNEYG